MTTTKTTPSTTPVTDNPEAAELKAQIAQLQAEQAELKAQLSARPKLSMKVSEKGGVSVYGLGRFPVTLYSEQWTSLLQPEAVKSILAFVEANKSKLSTKEQKLAAEQAKAEADRKARVQAYEQSKVG